MRAFVLRWLLFAADENQALGLQKPEHQHIWLRLQMLLTACCQTQSKGAVMTNLRQVVVATDFSSGSESAVARAAQVAQAQGAALCLLHAFDVTAWHALKGVFDPQRFTRDPPPDVAVKCQLTDMAATLANQTGLQVEALFTVGEAATAIGRFVAARQPGLLVMASRALPRTWGLGSTALRVLQAPRCPVLVVRRAQIGAYDTVMSAVDLRGVSVRAARLAVALFPEAQHALLCVADPAQAQALWLQAAQAGQVQAQQSVAQQLGQLAQELSAHAKRPVTAEVVAGVPAHVLVTRAAALSADCVVAGHHGQDNDAQPPMGTLAQQILQHSTCDVLVVP